MTESEQRTFVVTPDGAGVRLDKYLATHTPDLSRMTLKECIETGRVRLDGAVAEMPSLRLKPAQTIVLDVPVREATRLAPEKMPLDIVFEDNDVIVVNKPAGVVVHPGAGVSSGTLVQGLLYHCGTLSGIGHDGLRDGIVHRLDKDTSGLLVAAKTDAAHLHLAAQFEARSVERAYTAVVWGLFIKGSDTIHTGFGRDPKHRTRMAVLHDLDAGEGEAITHVRLKKGFAALASLLEVELDTGRTHQIRVHLTHAGFPIIGDQTYGHQQISRVRAQLKKIASLSDAEKECIAGFPRQALHAYRLGFVHPRTAKPMHFEADAPDDMTRLLAALRRVN